MNNPPPVRTPPDGPLTGPIPEGERREAVEKIVGAKPYRFYSRDPGFQPPWDPVTGAEGRTGYVYRDVPIVTIQHSWTVDQIRHALSSHMWGFFEHSAQLVDTILGDDRVQATLGSRVGGLFGREIRIKPANDSSAAKEVAQAWEQTAQDLLTGWALTESHVYGIFMGFAHGQIVWDKSKRPWRPYPRPWHPRYSWYEWISRHYIAVSQDGNLPIIPGDGKWYGHLPYGSYRAWIRGAVRAVAEPWAIRHFAIRDWARFSEVHGLPTRVGEVPAASDPGERSAYGQAIAGLGSNTTLLIPMGVDGTSIGYGYRLEEATDAAWESFPGLRDHCDLAIVLSIKFQNLTTEITSGGSYAAAKEHGKVDVSQIAADNRAWATTLHRDFARPFAFVNYGDADLAPWTDLDVPQPPREDYAGNSDALGKLATALQAMAAAGVKFDSADDLRDFADKQLGLKLPKTFSIGDPPATVTAKAADKTAEASHKTADAALTTADANKKKADTDAKQPKAPKGANGAPKPPTAP